MRRAVRAGAGVAVDRQVARMKQRHAPGNGKCEAVQPVERQLRARTGRRCHACRGSRRHAGDGDGQRLLRQSEQPDRDHAPGGCRPGRPQHHVGDGAADAGWHRSAVPRPSSSVATITTSALSAVPAAEAEGGLDQFGGIDLLLHQAHPALLMAHEVLQVGDETAEILAAFEDEPAGVAQFRRRRGACAAPRTSSSEKPLIGAEGVPQGAGHALEQAEFGRVGCRARSGPVCGGARLQRPAAAAPKAGRSRSAPAADRPPDRPEVRRRAGTGERRRRQARWPCVTFQDASLAAAFPINCAGPERNCRHYDLLAFSSR